MTEREVLAMVRKRMGNQSQGQAARSFGVAQGYFSQIIRGRARPSKQLLTALGLVAVVDYRKKADVEKAATVPARKPTRLFRYGDWPVKVGR